MLNGPKGFRFAPVLKNALLSTEGTTPVVVSSTSCVSISKSGCAAPSKVIQAKMLRLASAAVIGRPAPVAGYSAITSPFRVSSMPPTMSMPTVRFLE